MTRSSKFHPFAHRQILTVLLFSTVIASNGFQVESKTSPFLKRFIPTKPKIDNVRSSLLIGTSKVRTLSTPLMVSAPSDDSMMESPSDLSQGRMLLLIVALLYGTLNVSLRLIYNVADPPSASVLSAARGWMAALCFLPPLLMANKDASSEVATTAATADEGQAHLWKDGLELAIWNFGAQSLLTIGLLSTGSARASFITQTSVVLTPLLSMMAGQSVPGSVWVGCLLALTGLTLLSGLGGVAGGTLAAFSAGDALVLGGALCWSLYLFRLTQIAPKYGEGEEIALQATKTAILAALYSVWAIFPMISAAVSGESVSFSALVGGWVSNPVAWLLLFYSALGPGTLADVFQQQGQKLVPSATEANILLSSEPVFAAMCAWSLLGETMSMQEGMGGMLIILAALVATKD